jgi:D-alanine transaminase
MVFLNGAFLPLEEARVPVLDRGFIFGDGIYELIPVYSRAPFRMDEHLARLERSLAAVRIANPYAREQWRAIILELIAKQPWEDQGVYLQVTRGVAKRDHAFPEGVAPTVFAMANPLVNPPQRAGGEGRGRRERGRLPLAALRHQVRLAHRQRAAAPGVGRRGRGGDDPVSRRAAHRGLGLERVRGEERPAAFAAEVQSHPAGHHLRRGGRDRAGGRHPIEFRDVREAEVRGADEVWLTSSSKEILAVVQLDGKPVGEGRPGPLFRKAYAGYQDFKRRVMRKESVPA